MAEPMMHAPNEQQIKCLLDDLLKRGDRVRLANIFGVTEQAVSQRFSRNSEGPCHLYLGLKDMWAIAGANRQTGEELRSYVMTQFELWLGPEQAISQSQALTETAKEFADVVKAIMAKAPKGELTVEVSELIAAAMRLASASEYGERKLREA